MKNLKPFTSFFVFLYLLFVLMHALEALWNGTIFTYMDDPLGLAQMRFFYSPMEVVIKIRFWLNLAAYVPLCFFLAYWNQLVKTHRFGKSYHLLIVLLAFLPIANYELLYIIWRDLNKTLYKQAGKRSGSSDLLIVFIWILSILLLVIPLLVPYFTTYSNNQVSITTVARYSILVTVVHSVCRLLSSLLFLFYFLGLKQAIKELPDPERKIGEHELLDE